MRAHRINPRIILRIVGVSALLALLVVILLDVGHPLSAGTPAPPLPGLRWSDGRMAALDFDGRPTLINVWATWCPPCLAEMPELVAAHQEWGDRVRFVGLAADSEREHVLALMERFAITYEVAEIDASAARRWNVTSLPSTYLVGADGRIAWSTRGQVDRETLERELANLLPAQTVRAGGEPR
jgi:thiol-disulfide isomerase/thioredoxin